MTEWLEPETPPRGAVLVVGGRGEAAAVYRRLARRLAFDGYRVATLASDADGEDASAVIDRIGTLLAHVDPALPAVLIGSDAGAAAVARAAVGAPVAGVVVAGLLTDEAGGAEDSWDDELDARSACPVHRGVLAESGALVPGRLGAAGSALTGDDLARVAVPLLALHGDADRVSPARAAAAVVQSAPDAETVFVVGGRHDILNDVSHRSVAAAIVQFLERLRLADSGPILRRVDGADALLVERVG